MPDPSREVVVRPIAEDWTEEFEPTVSESEEVNEDEEEEVEESEVESKSKSDEDSEKKEKSDTADEDDDEGEEEDQDSDTFVIDGEVYDFGTLKAAVAAKKSLDSIEEAYQTDPVGFLQRLTNQATGETSQKLAAHFAKMAKLELVDPETGDAFDVASVEKKAEKPDPRDEEIQRLKLEKLRVEFIQERDAAIRKVGITYTEADQKRFTHPVNLATKLWQEDESLSFAQALNKVLNELNHTTKTEERKHEKKPKPKARPTPPSDDDDDPDDWTSGFLKQFPGAIKVES